MEVLARPDRTLAKWSRTGILSRRQLSTTGLGATAFEIVFPTSVECRHLSLETAIMKIGFALPNIGPIGTIEALTKVAQRAEALGYNSLWTVERLLWPLKPQTPYAATSDGSLPEPYKHTLDPLDPLTFAAALTKKIRLGTSVLDMPYYNPVTLARRLSTIDILSNGRLNVSRGWLVKRRNGSQWRSSGATLCNG